MNIDQWIAEIQYQNLGEMYEPELSTALEESINLGRVFELSCKYWEYIFNPQHEDIDKVKGKWVLFGNVHACNGHLMKSLKSAMNEGIAPAVKWPNPEWKTSGPVCLYVNDPMKSIELLQHMKRWNALPKVKSGALKDVVWKSDQQTYNGEYGDKFVASCKLSDLINLETGEPI